MLRELLAEARSTLTVALGEQPCEPQPEEVGTVLHVGGGIARVDGLPSLPADALVRLPGGLLGIAVNLEADGVGVALLGPAEHLRSGDEAHGTGRLVDTPVGAALLGRVVDAMGEPLDELGPLGTSERRPVERPAPGIMDRAPVDVPLQTGLKVVDALVPIGRGQRELIVGDRQSGKTAIAIDTILNQRGQDVVCVYCAIGQRGTSVARVVETLRRHGALEYSIVVVASGEDAPGLQFITPYAATTMAEWFMERGRDVLIVYDDLTRHARAYRELSLLLRRPPGREAFPGDIFYIHSRLLERATRLRRERGGGSLTALPIVETDAEDISAYIPTNLISITDGQIYVSPRLARKGVLPAVDVGKSVSRVGGKAQRPAYRAMAGDLRLSYAQFEELEAFARFATRLDDATRATIERGRRVREALKQGENEPLPVADQLLVLQLTTAGVFDAIPPEALHTVAPRVQAGIRERQRDAYARLAGGATLDEAQWQAVYAEARRVIADAAQPPGH
ncbi:MAG TPA: alternate F1F0 ATPase, F1 subunit alpha [Gammaproteobacteria bacterium]|jgi:F-type H+-transporting ATPase subunit alpha|nr:alternate F1F0 ATPase, F1 subunit alpha [Gammaproteobacteria bacterium]